VIQVTEVKPSNYLTLHPGHRVISKSRFPMDGRGL